MIRIIPFLFAFPAMAQVIECRPTEQLSAALTGTYGERALGTWVDAGGPITLWINIKTGTVSLTRTDGKTTCLVGAGQGFIAAKPVPPGELN